MTQSKMIIRDYVSHGVTIHPGELVLFLATCRHQTEESFGVYLGCTGNSPHVISLTPKTRWRVNPKTNSYERIKVHVVSVLRLGRIYSIKHFEQFK